MNWVRISSLVLALVFTFFPLRALAAPQSQGEDPKAKAQALHKEGVALLEQGDYQGAINRFRECVSIFHDIGDSYGEAVELSNLGAIHQIVGQYSQAVDYYKRAVEIMRQIDPKRERDLLNLIGEAYGNLKQYQQALDYYEQALALSRKIGDRAGEWTTHKNIGTLYSDMGQSAKALGSYEQALAIAQDMGDKSKEGTALNDIGATYNTFGMYPQAQDHLEQALAIDQQLGDRHEEATTLNNLAHLYLNLGQYSLARELAQQSLTICQEIGHRAGEAKSLHNIGGSYFISGQYLLALEYYRQARSIEQEIHDSITEGTTLNNIGLVYVYLGQYPQALDYLEQARTMSHKFGEATALNNIGAAYTQQGDYRKALDYYQQALVIQQTIGDQLGEGSTLNNLGLTYTNLGQPAQALGYFERALSLRKELGSQIGEGEILNNIGQAYFELGQYTQAFDYLQKALAVEQEVDDRAAQANSLTNLGLLYKQQSNNTEAIHHFQQAVELIESLQSEIKVEELKASFREEKIDAYRHLINLLWEENRFEEAFNYAERARARAFLDELANQHIDFRAGADAKLLEREQALRSEIAALHAALVTLGHQPLSEPNEEALNELKVTLAEREADFTQLLTEMKTQSPEALELVSVNVASLAEIQALLDAQTTLLEYFVTDDRTLVFLITKDTFETITLDIPSEQLFQTITDLHPFPSLDDPHPASLKQLHAWLIAPLKDKLITSTIGIIPHGVLHYLPFAALTDGAHYLGEEYTLFTLPSASALRFIQEKRKSSVNTILALGNPSTTEPGLTPLQSAQKEVEEIANLFGTQPLTGASATESALRSQASNVEMVHLAAHGEYNPDNALFSTIYLTGDAQNDGRLEVHEVYSLDLTKLTDLVVLSACQTDLGEVGGDAVSQGDEIVGLNRAFLYAGTPTVITSLWSVEDDATALLMKQFYTHLQAGLSKAEALQRAQRDVRAAHSHPYYWAAFVLTGDPGTAGPVPSPRPWIIIGLVLCILGAVSAALLLMGGVFILRRRRAMTRS